MSDKTPPPWFDDQNPANDEQLAERLKRLKAEMPTLLARQNEKQNTRAKRFAPYLLIRSVLGDRGDRPINVPFWESPDIWTAPGTPATTPAIPPSHGGTLAVGQPNTIYAHVWNLGFAPLAGVRVEFYWFDPSLAIDGSNAHPIGMARCQLAARGMAGSHMLVKCPDPWVPIMANGGHECLVVRISGIGDPVGNNEWSPWLNRHVGQRNVSVVSAGTSVSQLIKSLNATQVQGAHLQLIQLGTAEAKLAAYLVAPHLKVAPKVSTHLLSEVNALGEVGLVEPTSPPAGTLAPIHALAHGITATPPKLKSAGKVAIIDPMKTLGDIHPRVRLPVRSAHVDDLLGAVDRLQAPGKHVGSPRAGEAHVLRMATYSGTQLVGGYTLVVGP